MRQVRDIGVVLAVQIRTVIAACGILLLGFGLWQVSWPLAFIVTGALLVTITMGPLIPPLFGRRR